MGNIYSEDILQVVLFTVLWFKWSVKKHCLAKVLRAMLEMFLHENNCNHNSYKCSHKFVFTPIFSEEIFKNVFFFKQRHLKLFLYLEENFFEKLSWNFWDILVFQDVVPSNLVTNSLLSPFCTLWKTENNKVFFKLVVW